MDNLLAFLQLRYLILKWIVSVLYCALCCMILHCVMYSITLQYVLHYSVETNIRIYSNIRIFSSEYWYSYSIRGHFQNPNIIRIFEYFGPNIQKLFDGKILDFLRNRDKIWTIFCKEVVTSLFLLMRANMCKIVFN